MYLCRFDFRRQIESSARENKALPTGLFRAQRNRVASNIPIEGSEILTIFKLSFFKVSKVCKRFFEMWDH